MMSVSKYTADLVSIIVPCYNSESTVEKMYESILNQSYHNIQIVLVDDGSRDGTWDIINELKNKHDDTIIIQQENGGAGSARNNGIRSCDGEFIVFLDSDDVIDDHYVERMVCAIKSDNYDVAYCFYTRDNNNLGSVARSSEDLYIKKDQIETMRTLLKDKYRIGFTTFIYRHDVIDLYSLSFPEELNSGEDLEFLWTYLVWCKKCVEVNEYLYWYYDNPSSTVHTITWDRTKSLAGLERVKIMMEKNECAFSGEFYDYMTARYIWSYAKNFSVAQRKDFFVKLKQEFPVKAKMKYLIFHCPDIYVRLSSLIYLISSNMFYYMIGFVGNK